MKKHSIFLPLILLATSWILTACTSDPGKILPKKEGHWDVVEVHTIRYFDGEVVQDETNSTEMEFKFRSDGKGSLWFDGEHHSDLDWTYNEDNNRLTLINEQIPVPSEFIIMESNKNSQIWFIFEDGEFEGKPTRYEAFYRLVRRDSD